MVKVKQDPKKGVAKRLIRSPADVFYYSGDANDDGCLAIGKDCWGAQTDLKSYWQPPFDLEVLILAGCSVLNISFPYGLANGPGTWWAPLLKPACTNPVTGVVPWLGAAALSARSAHVIVGSGH